MAGAGFAAGEFAFKLRQGGYAGAITLIGEETHLPYHRPPLSKSFLAGKVTEDELLVRPQSAYDKAGIGFMPGCRVASIDRDRREVRCEDGQVVAFAKLVLATGGRARALACPGGGLGNVRTLRTMSDVGALRDGLRPGRPVVIVGGGYIGLEVAAVAVAQGAQVTIVEAAPRVLARVTGMEISAFYEKAHRDAGVTLLTGAGVVALTARPEAQDRVGAVVLADGRPLEADLVLVGVGLVPNDGIARAAGLTVNDGIWVDEFCTTDDPDILAIGDCSNHPSIFLGRRVRLESVPNALEQARVAADTIMGKRTPYDAVPWFWSDQYGLKLQAVGLSDGYDQAVLRGSMEARSFLMFYLRGGELIAADAVNRPGEFLLAKKLVAARMRPDVAVLSDAGRKLQELLAPV